MSSPASYSITGLGCLSAAGFSTLDTAFTFFNSAGRTTSTLDQTESRYFKLALEHEEGLYPPNRFARLAALEALTSAGLTPKELHSLRVGVCLGSTVGSTNYQGEFNHAYFLGERPPSDSFYKYLSTNSAQDLARHFELRGPVLMLNNACASGADAIATAALWLKRDLCDLVICGGCETIMPKIYYGFRSLQLCANEPCQPFDKDRQGLTLGEGAGILILEKADSPRAARARLCGFGMANDAFHPTSPHPQARGLEFAVARALLQANLSLNDISFVNAHATATPHNDLAEGGWLKRNLPQARVVATKGYTGHTLGAAGAIEAVFTALSLEKGQLPPSRGFSQLDPEIDLRPTTTVERGDYTYALSLSLGFGGANSVLCLSRAVRSTT